MMNQSITVSPMLDAISRGERNFALSEVLVVHNTGQNSTSGVFARSKNGQFSQHPLAHFGMQYEIEKEQSND